MLYRPQQYTADGVLEYLMQPNAPSIYLGSDNIMELTRWQQVAGKSVLIRAGEDAPNPDSLDIVHPEAEEAIVVALVYISPDKCVYLFRRPGALYSS